MEMDIPAITIEIGDPQRFKPEFVRRSAIGLRAVLSEMEMLSRTKFAQGPDPIVCDESAWVYTDHGGLLQVLPSVTRRVEAGEVIAVLTDVFGSPTREYRAPSSGVVVGHSTNPVAQTGARIIHLGHVVDPTDARFQLRS